MALLQGVRVNLIYSSEGIFNNPHYAAGFIPAVKRRSGRAFANPGFAGFVISLRGGGVYRRPC